MLVAARSAFQPQHNLLRGLSLLLKDGLRLTTKTSLLHVVTALTLRKQRCLARLVLGNLVRLVLTALLAGTESLTSLGDVH